jgi:hemolysin activation/secretion protein
MGTLILRKLRWTTAAFAAVVPASAQVIPPSTLPGVINTQTQQTEQQILRQTELPQTPSIAPFPPTQFAVSPPGGPTFVLRGVVVDDSHFLAKDEISAITSQYIGKRVDLSTVQRMVKEINDLFAARNLSTAAAFLPPQKLDKGVVHVQIVEGRLGKVTVKGANALSKDFVLSRVDLKTGEVIDLPAVSDRLAMFSSTSVARIQAALQPGAQFGLTDIELAVTEPSRTLLQLFTDNQGVQSVGPYEAGALFQLYAPLGIDDKLALYAIKAQGNVYGSGSYSLPFDPWGGRIGVSYNREATKTVWGPYTYLDTTGTTEIGSINASQPIFARSNWLLLLNASVSRQSTSSDQSSVLVTDDLATLETGGFKVAYNNGANVTASVAPTFTGVQSHSTVSRLNTDFFQQGGVLSAAVKLPYDLSLYLNGSWQVSAKQLIPSAELFQVGGPTTVRGYPTDAVAGPDGFYTNLELHRQLPFLNGSVDGFIFYDQGAVYNHYPSVQDLNALGLGIAWNVNKFAELDLSGGFPLNHVVNPQPVGQLYFRFLLRFD